MPLHRFYMMSNWVYFIRELKWSGSNPASYFDGLVRRARGKPPINYNITELYIVDSTKIGVSNFKGQDFEIEPNEPISTLQICFKTRLLQIDCFIDWSSDSNSYIIERLFVTFYFPDNNTDPYSFATYTFSYGAIDSFGPDLSRDHGLASFFFV